MSLHLLKMSLHLLTASLPCEFFFCNQRALRSKLLRDGYEVSKFKNQDNDAAVFTVALHPLTMHTRKGSFVTGLICPSWCIPANFRNTESCKRRKKSLFCCINSLNLLSALHCCSLSLYHMHFVTSVFYLACEFISLQGSNAV